jgi:hypothetical protein
VPALNGSSSNAPIGPFQNTVPAAWTTSAYSACVRGPDVEAHEALGHVDAVELAPLGVRAERAAGDEVDGQPQPLAALGERAPGRREPLGAR